LVAFEEEGDLAVVVRWMALRQLEERRPAPAAQVFGLPETAWFSGLVALVSSVSSK